MSMQDTVADMLTRIRNGQSAKHGEVVVKFSKLNASIAHVLKNEGYIADYHNVKVDNHNAITVKLKYFENKPVIEKIKRVSRPGLRVYTKSCDIQQVPGFGVRIISTPKGVMSHLDAKKQNLGGEVLCEVA